MVMRVTFGDLPMSSLSIVQDWVWSSIPCLPQTPDRDGVSIKTGAIQQIAMKIFDRVRVNIRSLALGK